MSENHEHDGANDRPRYSPPTIRPMNQDEVLEAFQVTSASISWWTM